MIENIYATPHWMTDEKAQAGTRAWVNVIYTDNGYNRTEIRRGTIKKNNYMEIRFNNVLFKFSFKELHEKKKIFLAKKI